MYVIGTAGHVDHGKSTLVRALTGIDPDRLREEKERGLTIDLGFAWLDLPSGREISIVDVPGHERFIKNMLAGAGGVDLALLVVAADEGPMPQTREHLAILDLLDVPAGIVVLTKIDLVEPDYADLVEAELEDVLKGSKLEGSPIVRVSAAAGTGLESLLQVLDRVLDGLPEKRDLGQPRLPIDRAFQIQGFGVVVTGTLLDGSLAVGDEVELQPGRLRARVRGLQRHRTKVLRLAPGTRAAVNLSGVRLEDVHRGMVLARPGTLAPARAVDVLLRSAGLVDHALQHDAGVTVLSATSESEAKVRLLDMSELPPGGEAWAQLVLVDPIPVRAGDDVVVRTSSETVAGGRVVAVNPRRHRRNDREVIEALERQLAGTPADHLVDLTLSGPALIADVGGRLGLEPAVVESAMAAEVAAGRLVRRGPYIVSAVWLEGALQRVLGAAEEYLGAAQLRSAAPKEHVRGAVRLDPAVFDFVVADAVAAGRLEDRGAGLAPTGYEVTLTESQRRTVDRFLEALRRGGASPPTDGLPEPALLAYLAGAGLVEDTGAGVVFDKPTFETMVQRTTEHIRATGGVSLAEVRDLFGTSRKYAQAFLEHLDAIRLTRRVGDARVLRPETLR